MNKRTLGAVAFVTLYGCAPQEPPAAPLSPPPEPVAAPVAVATAPAPAPAPLPPLTADERAKGFEACWGAFNAKDFTKLGACYAETGTSENVDSGFPVFNGRAEIIKNTQGFATEYPDANGELELTLVNGNNIASIVLLRGTNSGQLRMPGGATAPATNKKIGILMAHVIETSDDGRGLLHERIFLDASSLLGQLGLNPAPHRKLIEKSWTEKPLVLAAGSDVEKANLAMFAKGIEAFNKHDLKAVLADVADDAVWSEASAPADKVGKAAIKKSFQELFKGFSDIKIDVTKSWAAGDYVVSEGIFAGTNDGPMPSMKLKKTGKPVSTHFVEVDKYEGGKLKNSWIFDNGMAFAMQLGLVPPPGGAPAGKDAKTAPAKPAAPAPAAKSAPAAAAPAMTAAPAMKPAAPAAPASTK